MLASELWVGENGGRPGMAYPVAVGIFLRLHASAIEQDGGSFVFGALDQRFYALLRLRTDQGPEIGTFFKAAVHGEILRSLSQLWHPVLGLAYEYEDAQSHTTLTRGAESCAGEGIQGVVLVAIWEDSGMVLRAEVGLYTLPVLAASLEDVLACLVGPDEGDSLDARLVEDEVDGLC